MFKDRSAFLILFQFILILILCIFDLSQGDAPLWHWVLWLALLVVCFWLLYQRFNFHRSEAGQIAALKRAAAGNLNTRLLSDNLHFSNELIFSINALIEQLDQLHLQTLKSETLKKQLLSNFSHDLRTPLTSIIGYVDALKDNIDLSPDEKLAYLDIILNKAHTLKALIDEIFDLARLDADEMPLKMEELDFAEITREVAISFMPELKQNEMQLMVDIPENRCSILADALSLQRICGNLIKNAIEYGKSGGVLGLTLTAAGNDYHLHIWDKGQGIQAEDLKNVFERLYRADRSRNSLNRGSGLGLAIARALVEKNGGNIRVESTPGEKTVFCISFPQYRPDSATNRPIFPI